MIEFLSPAVRRCAITGACALLSGCLFPGSLSVSSFEGIVSISVGGVDIGTCFAEEDPPGSYRCLNNGVFSTFETLTQPELLFRLVLLDPLVVQFPAGAGSFAGSYLHNDSGASGALAITAGLGSVRIDRSRQLVAEPGQQLVVIGLPNGAPTTGSFSFNLNFQAPTGASAVTVKPIITGLVELTDGTVFYPPLLPCVTEMASAPGLAIPIPGNTLTLPALSPGLGCQGVTYDFRAAGNGGGGAPPAGVKEIPVLAGPWLFALMALLAGAGSVALRGVRRVRG